MRTPSACAYCRIWRLPSRAASTSASRCSSRRGATLSMLTPRYAAAARAEPAAGAPGWLARPSMPSAAHAGRSVERACLTALVRSQKTRVTW